MKIIPLFRTNSNDGLHHYTKEYVDFLNSLKIPPYGKGAILSVEGLLDKINEMHGFGITYIHSEFWYNDYLEIDEQQYLKFLLIYGDVL